MITMLGFFASCAKELAVEITSVNTSKVAAISFLFIDVSCVVCELFSGLIREQVMRLQKLRHSPGRRCEHG
jgi:hypothetical protein